MGCLIVSEDGNLYISVTQNGDITTSNKSYAKVFDEYKAKKLLKHLPKRLRKNGFSIQPIVKEKKVDESEPDTVMNTNVDGLIDYINMHIRHKVLLQEKV